VVARVLAATVVLPSIVLVFFFATQVIREALANPACTLGTHYSRTLTDGALPVTYRFTSATTCNFTIPSGFNKGDVVVVGGGGGAGFGSIGGGGGAGQVMVTSSPFAVTPGGSVSITVGAGGIGGWTTNQSTWNAGLNGGNSRFGTVTATGGGGGGGSKGATTGAVGGSGGGGAGANHAGGAATSAAAPGGWTKFGNKGGNGLTYSGRNNSGGGGGAQTAGVNGSSAGVGNGGTGVTYFGYALAGGGDGWQAPSSVTNQNFGGGGGLSNALQAGQTTTKSADCPACQGDPNTGGGGGGGGDGGSGVVMLRMGAAPTISTQPASGSVVHGSTRDFSVVANATYGETLSYQWQKAESTATSIWTNISGATSATYSIPTAVRANDDQDQFRVIVTATADGASAEVTSNAVVLTVTQATQSITFDQPANREWSATPFTITPAPTASSSLSVSLSSSTTPICTVSGLIVTMVKAGTCTLVAAQSGDTNFAAVTNTKSFTITAPTVTGIAFSSDAGADNTYIADDLVSVTVTFSQAVTVTNTPRIQLIGLSNKFANYASGSGTTQLVFSYPVVAGDNAVDGLALNVNTLSLNTTGTIVDAAGNAATLTHSAVTTQAAHKIDTTAPTMTVVASPSSVNSGGTSTVTFTSTKSTTTFALEDVSATLGTLSNFSGSGTTYTATFTASPTSGGTAVITVASGLFTDIAGNANTSAHTGSVTVTSTTASTGGR
jgi:hypothetical protein